MDVDVSLFRAVKWAAIECEKQRSGERSVWRMMQAWLYAYRQQEQGFLPLYDDVVHIGRLIDPERNRQGTRTVNVTVGHDPKESWQTVDRTLQNLTDLHTYEAVEPDKWYRMFEECHPFLDGNGRAGNVLWNWLNRSLAPYDLRYPPDFWTGHDLNEHFESLT